MGFASCRISFHVPDRFGSRRKRSSSEAHGAPMSEMGEGRVRDLVDERRPGFGLGRECYADGELFRVEMDEIWRKGWLFVGHGCEARRPGDYFTFEIDRDPIVCVRQEDGTMRAMHNVCRHRGSIVLVDERGHQARLTCPYHQWVYGLDGSLLRCQGVPEGFRKDGVGLASIPTEEIAGLVFVCLDDRPRPIERAREDLTRGLAVQGLDRAKVAMQIDYEVKANWKLIWENNRECFHCDVNHPQYVRANFDHYDEGDTRHKGDLAAALQRQREGLLRCGIKDEFFGGFGLSEFPDPTGEVWWSLNRTALEEGFDTESLDGCLVSRLMGAYVDPAVGTLRVRSLPNFWCHASCDHAVTTRLTPTGRWTTNVRVSWLVDVDAQEGRDYDLAKLLPFWQLTSEQDWAICERQQRGVASSVFVPGPLSPDKEGNVDRFLSWYTHAIVDALDASGETRPQAGVVSFS